MRLHHQPGIAELSWADQDLIETRPQTGEPAPIVPWRPVAVAAGTAHEYSASMSERGPVRIHEPRASVANRYLFPWATHPSISRAVSVDENFRSVLAHRVELMLRALDVARLDPSRRDLDLDLFELTTYLETVYRIGAAVRFESPDTSVQALPATILRALYEYTYATFPQVTSADARLLAHGTLWTAVYGFSPATAASLGVESGRI